MADARSRLLEAFERIPERHRDTIPPPSRPLPTRARAKARRRLSNCCSGLTLGVGRSAKPRHAHVIDLATWRRSREVEAGELLVERARTGIRARHCVA